MSTTRSGGFSNKQKTQFDDFFCKENYRRTYFDHIQVKALPGTDGVNRKVFENQLPEIAAETTRMIRNGTYRFRPYIGRLISRGLDRYPRLVESPTIRDKVTLRILYEYLADIYHDQLERRTLHLQIRGVSEAFATGSFDRFVRRDVENYYPTINQDKLLDTVKRRITQPEVLNLIRSSIQNPCDILKRDGYKFRKTGIPQGLSISGILANAYLDPVDEIMETYDSVQYFRYVDDILILGNTGTLPPAVAAFKRAIEERKVSLGTKKDKVGTRGDELQYLGYQFESGRITVRQTSVDRLCDSIANLITGFHKRARMTRKRSGDPEARLNFRLNLRITGGIFDKIRYGWMFFFSRITDEQLLHRLDAIVKRLCNRHGIDVRAVKSFVRTYYTIRRNLKPPGYIPDFDTYTFAQMREVLRWYGKDTISQEDVPRIFRHIVYRETSILERDMAGMS